MNHAFWFYVTVSCSWERYGCTILCFPI